MGACVNVFKFVFLACLFNQVYCFTRFPPNPSKTFRCKSGQYVASNDLCDTVQDCSDGSDEPNSCKTWNCGPGQFSCVPNSNSTKNATCLNAKVLCDTRKDCADNFDEDNCGDLINVQNCELGDGKFLCRDKLRCLGLENTCDGYCNCFDCSDENENCTKIDYQSLSSCPNAYYPLPLSSGPICLCNSSNAAYQNLCKEVKNCTSGYRCDQKCSQYKNRILCSCFEDFTEVLVSNGFKCRSKKFYGTELIYTTTNQIKALNATTKQVDYIKNDVQTQILAASRNSIYYTIFRDKSRSIYQILNYGSSKKNRKILDLNSSIISIAIDYITENVYFTTNESLSVCSKGGEICLQLKCCDVSYVVLNPKNGTMFYTKSSDKPNERLLMRSYMDGNHESVFIDGSFPDIVPVAVDEEFYRLYWLEGNRIHSISLHDKTIDKRDIRFNHALKSLTILDEIVFYTSQRDNKIYQAENLERFVKSAEEKSGRAYYDYYERPLQDNNYTLHTDADGTISIIDVKSYNAIRQLAAKAKNPCNSSCKGLCLLRSVSRFSLYYGSLFSNCICNDFSPSKSNNWCGASPLQINTPNDADGDDDGFPFMMTFLILIVLSAVLSGMYFVYDRYYRGVVHNSRRSQDDRIYDPNQDEF
ncbi:low-density lipoprotein receptor-like isoform X2 [Planococcus citri]|uniref:low-density lipoprotein receptor-like isoform X2 n=1 Tax=Planococcus citri TaxID=170843 RepID=UPI0031F8F153